MPIPLSLVGFADALDPWAFYRNHPVVRTPGGWHASGRRRPLGRIARGGLGRGGVNAAAMSSAGDLADVVQFVDDPCDQFVNKSDDDRASGEGIARPITRAVRRSGRSALARS